MDNLDELLGFFKPFVKNFTLKVSSLEFLRKFSRNFFVKKGVSQKLKGAKQGHFGLKKRLSLG